MTTSSRLLLGTFALGLVTVLIATAPLGRSAVAAPPRAPVSSPLVGIVDGQRAHLTLAHPAGRKGTEVCEAVLAFVDAQARMLKQQTVRIGPGEATFLALDWHEGTATERARLHYRATVTPLNDACTGAIAGHEMVENADNKTSVFIGVYTE
jgi:hypothetical protein